MLVLRLVITVICIATLIWSGVDAGNDKWFIYLTNWSFTLLTMAFISLTLLSIYGTYMAHENNQNLVEYGTFETSVEAARRQEENFQPSLNNRGNAVQICKWYHKLAWLICNIAFCVAFIVSSAYWLFQASNVDFIDVITHGFNSVFVIIELLLGGVPIRLIHCIFCNVYCAVYVLFSVIYWQADGLNARGKPYIYKILDYENQNAGVTTVLILSLAVIAPPLSQLFMLGMYKMRCHWYRRRTSPSSVHVTSL